MIAEAVLSSALDCQAPELILIGQAVALEALEALEALAPLLSSTLSLTSLALAPMPSSAQHCQALEPMLVGHAVALEALEALALMRRLDHRGRARREDVGLSILVLSSAFVPLDAVRSRSIRTASSLRPSSTQRCGSMPPLLSSGFDVPDTDVCEVDQDGLMTKNEFNFAVLDSIFSTLTLSVSISRLITQAYPAVRRTARRRSSCSLARQWRSRR